MKFQPPRGTRDYLPPEMAARRAVCDTIRRVFGRYGYGEVATPAFENFDLLATKSGPAIESEIYVFTDKSGRKLGLRFDPTVPICRIVASTPGLPKPIRFSYVTNMWRYDRPQAGRLREFWQAGVELIGSARPEADAEVVSVVADALAAVGITKFSIRVNSRHITERLVAEAGIAADRKLAVFRALDKLDKAGEEAVVYELERSGITEDQAKQLLSLLRTTRKPRDAHTEAVLRLLKAAGIRNAVFAPSLVRGLDYYTGFVFEVVIRGQEQLGSVAGGGRYDSLIRLYGGEDLPATGVGIGIERLMEIIPRTPSLPAVLFVVPVAEIFGAAAGRAARDLRAAGIACETDVMGRSLRKRMEYANTRGIRWAVFVGEREVKSGRLTLRDMQTGKERRLSVAGIAAALKK